MTHEELFLSRQAFVLPKDGNTFAFDLVALHDIARNDGGMRAEVAKALISTLLTFAAGAAPTSGEMT